MFSRLSVHWLFVIALVPGTVAGMFQFYRSYEDRRTDLEMSAQQTARALSQVIDGELAGIVRSLQFLGTSQALRDGDYKTFHDTARQFLNSEALVRSIVLIDETGQQVVNTFQPWGETLPKTGTPELVRKVISSQIPSNSDLFIGAAAKQPYVAVGVPVEVKGRHFVLIMGIQLRRLARFLAEQKLEEGWVAALLDSGGKVIARNLNQDEMVGKPSRPELKALIAESEEGTMPSRTLEGKPSFLAFHRSHSSGWTVAVAMPQAAVHSSMYGTILLGMLSIFASLVAGISLAGVLSRQVRSALQNLEAATAIAAEGDLNATAAPGGPKEIATLARRFNEMQAFRRETMRIQQRISRALVLLNESNTALLLADDEARLLPEICRLIVDKGDYLMAWVGFAEADQDKTVRPIAWFGPVPQAYLDRIRVTWADDEWGRGPTGSAIRCARTSINQNVQTNPAMAPWREVALDWECRSSIGLPLLQDGVVIGALTIYAREADAFSPEEASLLEKLASNLSFGIERLRIRSQLAVANKELQGFTYAASHDMKAPLQRISTFSGMLEKALGDRLSDNERIMFGFIKDNAKRIIELIDDLLDHAQIENVAISTEPIKLRDAVQAALREKGVEFDAAGARLTCELPDMTVQASPLALAQVLRNLLANALKYSARSQPPAIKIGAQADGEVCRLWVKDNGIGFDIAYHDQIFEIFRRLHTYADIPGNGVGLALVKKAMERMGGKVWAISAPDEGATFFIELALAQKQGAGAQTDQATDSPVSSGLSA